MPRSRTRIAGSPFFRQSDRELVAKDEQDADSGVKEIDSVGDDEQDEDTTHGRSYIGGVEDRMGQLGEFIRERRNHARLSLRKLSEQAGISNPYLSQIERGLRKPSAEILQAIAKALRISSETLYVRAGILDERHEFNSVESAIHADPLLTERHKQVLADIYESFRSESRTEDETESESESESESENSAPSSVILSPGASQGVRIQSETLQQ